MITARQVGGQRHHRRGNRAAALDPPADDDRAGCRRRHRHTTTLPSTETASRPPRSPACARCGRTAGRNGYLQQVHRSPGLLDADREARSERRWRPADPPRRTAPGTGRIRNRRACGSRRPTARAEGGAVPVPLPDGEAGRGPHRGLSPAISIEQKSTSHNPRSTVGTITEIYDYLRLLFARVGSHAARPTPFRSRPRPSARWWIRCWPSPKALKLMLLAPWCATAGSTPSCWRTWRPRVTSAPASTARCAICRILPPGAAQEAHHRGGGGSIQGAR